MMAPNRRRDKLKKLMVLLTAMLVIVLSTGVFAAWQVFASSGFAATVTSTDEAPIRFTVDFSDVAVNTTYNFSTELTTAELSNDNGNIDVTATINISRDDVSDDCTDFFDDCDVTVKYDNGLGGGYVTVDDQDDITVPGNTLTDWEANVTCEKWSCPQVINVSVSLVE